jgi:uncharacterized damage-inducible protein DinB
MGPKDLLKSLVQSNDSMMNTYLGDLNDADLLVRPAPGANHIAWQLGHLINAEQSLMKSIPGGTGIELPAGWGDRYTGEASRSDSTTGYLTKTQYLEWYKKSRENLVKTIDRLSDKDLDTPSQGRLAQMFPTVGLILMLMANHPLMHAGQIVVVRRKLGKPVVI